MNKKLIIKILATSLILASIIGNGYFFGNRWWTTQKNKWISVGVRTVFATAVKNGQVILNTDDENITLIISTQCQLKNGAYK